MHEIEIVLENHGIIRSHSTDHPNTIVIEYPVLFTTFQGFKEVTPRRVALIETFLLILSREKKDSKGNNLGKEKPYYLPIYLLNK